MNDPETLVAEPIIPTIAEATRVWWQIGLLSFGGPAAQIALMHRLLVEQRKWLSEQQYLNALSFCMLLPGPEAMQLATYAGWRMHGVRGGLIAGLLFVLPGAVVVLMLSVIYALYGDVPLITTLFIGVKATVLVIVLQALYKVSSRALKGASGWLIALSSFIGIFFLDLPFPLIILAAALVGYFSQAKVTNTPVPARLSSTQPSSALAGLIKTILIWGCIWATPMLLVMAFLPQSVLVDVGLFFSRLAVVTFGGAYAVLAYMGQAAVSDFGWLAPGEMMDGLGLAETTPGPLILVTEFVGFLAGYREAGIGLGLAAATLTLWVTFVPCFLWIFAGAPFIETICAQPRLRNALTAISAAVVGVILNLSIWFALHVLFAKVELQKISIFHLWKPELATLEILAAFLTLLSGWLLLKLSWPITRVLLIAATLALGLRPLIA